MAALVTIYNDGPDEIEVKLGGRWLRLSAGQSTRTNATLPVEVNPMPKTDPVLLALDLGHTPEQQRNNLPPCRVASDSD